MRSLLVLRHAKSSWKDPALADHDRPINKRGRSDAPRMGHLLKEHGLAPDLILCSTARRARQTAKRVVGSGEFDCSIELREDVYHGHPEDLIEAVRSVPDDRRLVMLVGHNPGLEELVRGLTGVPTTLPTAAVAHIELDVESWSAIDLTGAARLIDVWRPKELAERA